jgi:TolB-like protein
MKKIVFVVAFFLVIFAFSSFCEEITISVGDFKVESDNPSYKYLGKGISRLVASELRNSGNIRLIEREQLLQLLKEQEFSVSDLADQEKSIKIGKMLSAKYVVLGEIIDMVAKILTSARLINVETGEIVWQGEVTEKLETYDYIGAYFAKSILTKLGSKVDVEIAVKVNKKEEKSKDAVIDLSDGIDAYDKGDTTTAKKELESAKKLDPENRTVSFYLAKLITNTSKFKVIIEPYFQYQNPAYLGIIRNGRLHTSLSGSLVDERFKNTWDGLTVLPNNDVLSEGENRGSVGYYFPCGENLGLGIESITFWTGESVSNSSSDIYRSERFGLGGLVSAGYKIGDSFSIGLGTALFNDNYEALPQNPLGSWFAALHPAYSITLGFLYRNDDESFIFDTYLGYSNATTDRFDYTTLSSSKKNVPLYWENTATFALNEKHTFIIIKQLNDISFDRTYYNGRLMPAIENFFFDWLSLRLGVEGSFVRLNSVPDYGLGVLGGVTLRIIDWGLDVDLNLTYRRRPSRIIEDTMYKNDVLFNIDFTWNNTGAAR